MFHRKNWNSSRKWTTPRLPARSKQDDTKITFLFYYVRKWQPSNKKCIYFFSFLYQDAYKYRNKTRSFAARVRAFACFHLLLHNPNQCLWMKVVCLSLVSLQDHRSDKSKLGQMVWRTTRVLRVQVLDTMMHMFSRDLLFSSRVPTMPGNKQQSMFMAKAIVNNHGSQLTLICWCDIQVDKCLKLYENWRKCNFSAPIHSQKLHLIEWFSHSYYFVFTINIQMAYLEIPSYHTHLSLSL